VGKIIAEKIKSRPSTEDEKSTEKINPNVPFHGYRP
jgi:hypothetical protein